MMTTITTRLDTMALAKKAILSCLNRLFLLVAFGALASSALAQSALKLHWLLNEGSGSVAVDTSGTGNSGTLVNGPVWASGVTGGALNFDGVNDAVTRATVSGLAVGNTPHTIAAWIKVNALPANRAWILLLGNDGAGAHHWLINSSGGTQFGVWSGGAGAQSNPVLPVGQWVHMALTFDGGTLRSYQNGVLIKSTAATFNLAGVAFRLAQPTGSENYFNGQLADIRVCNAAVSADEVAALANLPPAVSLTTPANNTVVTAPATVSLTANAADPNGSIAKVEFYNGTTLLGSATSTPYSLTWSNAPAGTYTLTVQATDNTGNVATSAPSTLIVNAPPTVRLTAPASHTTYAPAASITLTAEAADSDGTIAKVEFYQGVTLIGSTTTSPYSVTWNNLAAGSYLLTARATDDRGAIVSSTAVPVQVGATTGVQLHYLHTDHLDTPRLITNEQNQTVWRNSPLTEPFGLSPVDEDADANGSPFTLNLRFPGQLFDKETQTHYNHFRDYDPSTGRYLQSDPIGLQGGINTYAYVSGNPLKYTDPLGLEVQFCCAPVDVNWVPSPLAAVLPKHCWLKTDTYESGMAADCPVPGQQCSDKPGADTATRDHSGQSTNRKGAECTPLKNIDEKCVDAKIKPGLPTGMWHPYNQCQSFAAGVMGQCRYGPNIGPTLPAPAK